MTDAMTALAHKEFEERNQPQRIRELPTFYQQFIHKSRYARWDYDLQRREEWGETVQRYIDFFDGHLKKNFNYSLSESELKELRTSIGELKVMPSMRCLMTAGEALEKENVAGYNCSFVAVDTPRAFDEILYVLMNGTGVGFSVETKYTNKLPVIHEEFHPTDTTIVVADSKLGWAKALKQLIALLYNGEVPSWDVSKVRPAGAPLKTFGGRASGPEPLVNLFNFCTSKFKAAAGRKLTSLECHDIVCKIAEIVVVGGVRRSALISLSDLNDRDMRYAKSGNWWESEGQRALSNNSVNYQEKPGMGSFMKEWLSLYDSKSGERGIFSSYASKKSIERLNDRHRIRMDRLGLLGNDGSGRGDNSGGDGTGGVGDDSGGDVRRRSPRDDFGTNPCSEIILRSREFCNLSEVVIRRTDTLKSLKAKVRTATIIGTLQSTLTNFKYLTKEWENNCKEERLLGVSMTGIMDNPVTNGSEGKEKLSKWLQQLREVAVETNEEWSDKLGIERSAAITCVKPSGTVSQLVDSASGIHARHNPYYIRTVRADNKDPLCQFMKDMDFPHEPDFMKPDHTTVFSFPMKSPDDAVMRYDRDAIEQMELWKTYLEDWCEHKPSITVSVKENEWMQVGSWVYDNMDDISGISFLPFSDHVYAQAPYQDCDEETYNELLARMPKNVNWEEVSKYEAQDYTAGAQELACAADGGCEVVDI